MCNVVAKKREDGCTQSLDEHTFEVVEQALRLIYDEELSVISKEIEWNKEKIKDLIFLCAYFHDIGKATKQFEETIENDAKSYHSLYSAGLFIKTKDFNFKNINMLMMCILTHHSILNEKSTFKTVGNNHKFKFEFLKYAEDFFCRYKDNYKKYMGKKCMYDFIYREPSLKEISTKIRLTYESVNAIRKKEDCKKLRLLYSYVIGILNLSDWIASAKFNQDLPKIQFNKKINKRELCGRLAKSLDIKEFKPKKFQNDLSDFKGSVLVEIPTGEGKTEGSFLWGINNLKNKYSKLIYTLPTQTTSNKLYERAINVFSNDTGLIHGASKVYLEKKYEDENGQVNDKCKSDILFSQTFNKGMTISTIDSLFKYFLNIGRYNIAMFNFMKSVIIIDEIHSYDFKMMGFIKRFLEICKYYKVPVCIMSASIPNKIKELIGINSLPIITDTKLFDQKANYIHKVEDSLDNNLDNIVNGYNEGKNILIVRNNIKSSVETFQNLKNKKHINNIILYNSQFKKKDRVKKEKEIYDKLKNKEHFILVATQVVEISLDINFDVMYTDNAPIDSLIQRFGRVNRKKDPNNIGHIFIFKDTLEKPYYYRMLEITYETIEEGIFTIGKYTEWLNNVYDKLIKDKKIQDKIKDKFQEGYKMLNKVIKNLHGIEQSDDIYNLRDIEFPKRDFILQGDYDKKDFRYENTVSLPAYLGDEKSVHLIKDNYVKTFYDILNFEYNYEIGVKMDDIFCGDD